MAALQLLAMERPLRVVAPCPAPGKPHTPARSTEVSRFIWLIREDKRLSPAARSLFQSPKNKVFLSAISAWEIAVKHYAGKLPLARPAHEYIPMEREKHGIATLDLDETATFELRKLPAIHADPFDRLLICQAIAHQMTILTPDPLIHQYPVSVKW